MNEFELDTTGAVIIPNPNGSFPTYVTRIWEDFSPFEQGAIRAALTSFIDEVPTPLVHYGLGWAYPSYDNLAPETLVKILKDCAKFNNEENGLPERLQTDGAGWNFWLRRNDNARVGFPPVKLYLDQNDQIQIL